jgi:hypothetical protein
MITDFKTTSTGPVAKIRGYWHSVNGTSRTNVVEVRYTLRDSELEALGLVNDLTPFSACTPEQVELAQKLDGMNKYLLSHRMRIECAGVEARVFLFVEIGDGFRRSEEQSVTAAMRTAQDLIDWTESQI